MEIWNNRILENVKTKTILGHHVVPQGPLWECKSDFFSLECRLQDII